MIRKGKMRGVQKENSLSQATFTAELFGAAISIQQRKSLMPRTSSRIFLQHNLSHIVKCCSLIGLFSCLSEN
jgi:hypothetical protein